MINDYPSSVILSTTYFGPIEWYQKLNRTEVAYIEACESFVKQTYRSRCVIATANGRQTLSVPVEHGEERGVRQVRISNHGNWRHLHWNALASAYGESPFFDYYIDDLRPFFEEEWEYLFDFNLAIMRKMTELLDIRTEIKLTEEWNRSNLFASTKQSDKKKGQEEEEKKDFQPRRYWQVFEQKHGFMPNLSILDLLFNMGNEAILYL